MKSVITSAPVSASMLDIHDLSAWLKIKTGTLYAWASQGRIPCIRVHGLLRFEPDEIDRWVKRFRQARPQSLGPTLKGGDHTCLDDLIARAKGEIYNPPHGETKPQSSSNRKEEDNGAV